MQNGKSLLGSLSVISLGVSEIGRSIAFYHDTLGLTMQSESGEFAFFALGGQTLMLNVPLMKNRGPAGGATEFVFSVEHVRQAYEELRAREVTFINEPRPVTGPMWGASFTDPDGHLLTVFGPE